MLEELAFIGKDATAVVVVLTVIAAISLQITRRSMRALPGVLSIAAFRARLPVIDYSHLNISLPNWRSRLAALRGMTVQIKPDCPPVRQPLSIEVQWARLTGVISSRISRMERADTLQRRAASQIDAASYALECMFDDLSEVMAITRTAMEPSLRLVEMAPVRAPHVEPLAA